MSPIYMLGLFFEGYIRKDGKFSQIHIIIKMHEKRENLLVRIKTESYLQ